MAVTGALLVFAFLVLEIYILCQWLRILEVFPNYPAAPPTRIDYAARVFWIALFLCLPILWEMPKPLALPQFLIGLVFGRMFWGSFNPDPDAGSPPTLADVIWEPLFNVLFFGALVIPVVVFVGRKVFWLTSLDRFFDAYLNYALNFFADLWPPYPPTGIPTTYHFEYSLVFFMIFAVMTRIFAHSEWSPLKRFIAFLLIAALLPRLLKYSGQAYQQITELNFARIRDEYSVANVFVMVAGWALGMVLRRWS